MLRISVYSSRQLQAVTMALKQADRTLRKEVRRETKAMVDPAWRSSVAQHASTRLEHATLVRTARVKVTDQNVMLQSARVGRKLRGGLNPKQQWYAVEFGAERERYSTYTARSRRGTPFRVKRRTAAGLRDRNRKGYVVWQAAADVIPRIAALWTQTAARTLHEAFEARR